MISVKKLDFKPVGEQHITLISECFSKQSYRTGNYTVGSIMMWRKVYNLRICEIGGTAVIAADYPGEGLCHSIPVGDGDVRAALHAVYDHCISIGARCIFSDVPDEGLNLLYDVFGKERCAVQHLDAWDDYLYNADDLINYTGKKFSGQRNHVHKFERLYPDAVFSPITDENREEAFAFLREYVSENGDGTVSGENESRADLELLPHYDKLNLCGGILADGEKIIAISIGEQVGDTLFIHIEKGNTDYAGVYQVMVQRFAQHFAKDAVYINREEDDGVEGLRRSKLSYHPVAMLRKHSVKII